MHSETPKRGRGRKPLGRIRLVLTFPPAMVDRVKEQARKESDANGGAMRYGGKGRISVSDIIERWVSERLNKKEEPCLPASSDSV